MLVLHNVRQEEEWETSGEREKMESWLLLSQVPAEAALGQHRVHGQLLLHRITVFQSPGQLEGAGANQSTLLLRAG